jgi:putative ABC transport system permease protein
MNFAGKLRSWFKSVMQRSQLEHDMDAELRFHIESRAEDLKRSGLAPDDALRQARLEFGGLESHKDEMRTSLGLRWWDELRADLRFALRMMAKNRGFTAAAVLTLAMGIGANTAIFTVVNATLIRPLPYPNANRLVMVWESRRVDGDKPNTTSPATFMNWQERNTAFEKMAVTFNGSSVLTGGDVPEQLPVQLVSPNFFSLLGTNAALGRVFNPDQEQPGAADVALLSFELWQRRFGANPNILGSKIILDGDPTTIIGVMPRSSQFFVKENSFGQEKPQLWLPMTFSEKSRARHGRYLQAVGLLRPGVTLAQAQSAMQGLATQLAKEDPASMKDWGVKLVPLRTQLVGAIEPGLRLLLAAVALVLLIACANIATLFLARAIARRHEIAIRMALGAETGRVVRQILTESCLIAVCGGIGGILLALWATQALQLLAPLDLVPLEGVHVDAWVLGFTAIISAITGLLFGIVPALQTARSAPREPLQEGRTLAGGAHQNRVRNGFAVAQIALALILLAASGLLIRSFSRLTQVDPGFQADHVLTAHIQLPNSAKYKDEARSRQFFSDLLTRLRQLPDVRSASADSFLPFSGIISGTGVEVEGRPSLPISQQPSVNVAVVEPQFFETMGIPLLRGRTFTDREATELSHKVVISQAMARELWPNEDPIGKHVTIHMKREDAPSEVIGIAGDVKHAGLDEEVHATAYWPYPELTFGFMTLIIRTDGDPLRLAPAVRQVVSSLDKDQPVTDIRTMESLLAASTVRTRFATVLMAAFSAMALLLAMLGIYGVVTYNVEERTREIGIRLAFGASRAGIQRMLLKQGMWLTLWGTLGGTVAALVLTRLLAKLLFGTKAYDPATFVSVAVLLSATALLACALAAKRATGMQPLQALRCE